MANNWTSQQLIVAFYQYCITPYGQIDGRNKEIIALAAQLGRTPGALAMKMCNFASFDPIHLARGVKGLSGASKADKETWDRFYNNWDELLVAYQAAAAELALPPEPAEEPDKLAIAPQITETIAEVKIRLGQNFIRRSIMANYGHKCAICSLADSRLLNASHIIPWKANEARRCDPQNGLSLCSLHDRAFDRGLITLDNDYRIILSPSLSKPNGQLHEIAFIKTQGQQIILPDKFAPDKLALEYHRDMVFVA